ncbi:MAG: superoxide dismutase [Ni] [Planctomycetota bacterium]
MARIREVGWSMTGLAAMAAVALFVTAPRVLDAHCQVPCGIYDDPARIAELREDATTIEKAIAGINELASKNDAQSLNQAVRWVTTKDGHADHAIELVSAYFFAQRVKPVAAGAEGHDAYLKSLAAHHAVIVAAMKCKQNADAKVVEDLRKAIDGIAGYYTK